MQPQAYHYKLRRLMDEFVHKVYDVTNTFPRHELFGLTSQIRRASLSIILNYIEGYARQRDKVHKSFLEISYGSFKETQYLIGFSYKRKYVSSNNYEALNLLGDEIGRMLWGTLSNV